jgi:carboxyl-terminal processing protease
MSRWNLGWLLGIAAAAVLGIAVSYSAPLAVRDKDYELVHLFVDVLSNVEKSYVRELDPEAKRKLVEDMINGGLERLDPHSAYINPRRFKQFNTESKGKFGGVGIQISTDHALGGIAVIGPLVGTPAYEAGIMAGDLIVKIDGKSTESMPVTEAVDMIQGQPGEKVTLGILHHGAREPVDVELTRAIIHVDSVLSDARKPDKPEQWDYFVDKANHIAYIRIAQFSETTATELRSALEQLQKEGMRGLVLDLRNNPGGLLRAAVEVTNFFIPEGRIVSTRDRNGQEDNYDAQERSAILAPAQDFPVVVLVNKFSASASEILAAALQDHHRAIIIGERTYGKGSVQNVIKMDHAGGALKLTTASYWRPSGKNIHRFPDSKDSDEWGVKPDPGYEVPMKDEERIQYVLYRRDRDIIHGRPGPVANGPAAAAETPKTKSAAAGNDGKDAKSTKAPEEKKPFVDRVLNRALDYLRDEVKKAAMAPASEAVVG